MNEKEISEIRRRFRPDKSNITHVRGCYVNERQEIVAAFDQSLALLPQEESENLLAVLRRTLSGTLGKNLIDMPFSTALGMPMERIRPISRRSGRICRSGLIRTGLLRRHSSAAITTAATIRETSVGMATPATPMPTT